MKHFVPLLQKDLQDNDIKIDVAVVSHNHFDHLDKEAVLELKDTVMWFVPVNMKHWFAFQKTTNVVELDWWQASSFRCCAAVYPVKHTVCIL